MKIMSLPVVSVIVPAYGVAHLLGDALASLQAQTLTDWEAIVVDDGAPDDVAGAFAVFADDERIGLLQTDNGGVSVARNRAVAIARAPLLAFLDGDDAYRPRYLEMMTAALARDPKLGFVTCDATLFGAVDREDDLFSRHTPQVPPVTLERVLRREITVLAGSTLRREAFEGVGGFDPELRTCEDFHLWLRLLAAGWAADYVAEPLVRYRKRAGSLSSDDFGMLDGLRLAYMKIATLLDGRPEADVARAMLAEVRNRRDWIEGETLILGGHARAGLRKLEGAERRSLRWRLAMPVMRAVPALAAPLMRLRPRLPERSR